MSNQTLSGPRHVTSLDGIRAICIVAVMGHHFGLPGCEAGWIGVEVFFVLSGFLITTLLCRELHQAGSISLKKFWARRGFRLLPIYWLYISLLTAAIFAGAPAAWTVRGAWTPSLFVGSMWGYFVNFAPPGLWTHQLTTYHLWSLAMEEQFYFCWPLLCVVALRWRRPWLLPAAAVALSVAARFAPLPQTMRQFFTYVPLGLLAGCTVALVLYRHRGSRAFRILISNVSRNLFAAACVILFAALVFKTHQSSDSEARLWANRWLVPVMVWPMALLIAGLWYGPAFPLGQLMAIKPLAYIGKVSYGMYLYHMLMILAVRAAASQIQAHLGVHIRFATLAPAYVASVIAAASLSYHLIETPFLSIGSRFRAKSPGTYMADKPTHLLAGEATTNAIGRISPHHRQRFVGADAPAALT